MYRAKRDGLSEHPCLSPLDCMWEASRKPFTRGVSLGSGDSSLIISMYEGGKPRLCKIWKSVSWMTLLNALERSR